MGHTGKFIYLAKEFIKDHGEDFSEDEIRVFSNKYDLDYTDYQKFILALNDLLMGEELNTSYTPKGNWVPDIESAHKVADSFGFTQKGDMVILDNVYTGQPWPEHKYKKRFMAAIGYPEDLWGSTHKSMYSSSDGTKRVREIQGRVHTYVKDGKSVTAYERALVFSKLKGTSSVESLEDRGLTNPFSSTELNSTGGQMTKWNKYRLSDFAISKKKGSPYLYATLTTGGIRGLEPRKKPVFFPHKIIDNSYVVVPNSVVREIENDTTWVVKFPSAVEQVAEEAYAVIKTAAPFGAKSFTVVGDKATAARVARIKNKTVEDDDKHTYIYRKMDEVNSEKYNIPVNEGVENMKGLVDKLLALGQETASANENYAEARPNSQRLLEQLDDYLDGKTLAEELINWMSDDEVGRFAEESGYFPDEGDFADEEDSGEEFEAEEGLTEKDQEVLDELPPEQPVGDSQALDEEQGKPVKSATEKKSVYEEYDEMEREMFEAMNRNSITDFQASVSDSISRIGSLGTIQLLLDSELADSFQDELFFIKNTYDLSDTQLVSQAILDAGETLLEDGELERAMEILKNSSEEENEEEFGEYEEPEDWSEVDQVEEGEVGEPVEEGEPTEGEEVTEEETELEEENI